MTLAMLAAIVLTVAVGGGAVLGQRHARGRGVKLALGLAHAAVATAGLVLLATAVFGGGQPGAVNAALLLVAIALLGGGFLLLFRLQGDTPPGFMIALHGLTALAGLASLWAGLLLAG